MSVARTILIPSLAALAVLIAGLVPGVLETGRLDPLDWLLWGGVALLALLLLRRLPARIWSLLWYWALMALPVALLCALAGTTLPWAGIGLVWLGLAGAVVIAASAARKGTGIKWVALVAGIAILLAMRIGADRLLAAASSQPPRLTVGVVSALPLYGVGTGSKHSAVDALRAVGTRSPLWQALEEKFDLRPLDAVDDATLQGVDRLLLAHPRQLTPAELVAIDHWVRAGGRAVILADPLLRWPDPRALTDPRRAPLTSLLDPLLAHWGLMLQPADAGADSPPERHMLSDGTLLQTAGASRFALAGKGACILAERDFIAQCGVGQGEAVLIADADWINDVLWTLAPDRPRDKSAWTSDAIPTLSHLLTDLRMGDAPRVGWWHNWLIDEKSLISGLRWAIIAWLALTLLPWTAQRFPISSQMSQSNRRDQKENIDGRHADSG